MGGQVTFTDPRAVVELTLDLRGFTIPKPGGYAIQVEIGGEVVKQRRLQAVLLQAGGQER